MEKIIITGATGCVGSAVVRAALSKDYEVSCIVHRGSTRLRNLPKSDKLHIIECNIDEYSKLELSGKYDVFIQDADKNAMVRKLKQLFEPVVWSRQK